MDAEKLANACERIFPLKDLTLSPSYSYDSLPLCLIDAVFSIGVKYTSTQNVVEHYCAYFKLNEFNMDREHTSNRHSISDFIKNIEAAGIEKSANEVFCNRQRTSSRNGILKAEAVLRIARIIQKDGVETFEDLWDHGLSEKAEAAIKQVPGQKSGLSLAYFYMLSGDDSLAKPDRHVLRFIAQHTGMTPNIQEAQKLLTDTVSVLSEKYPNLSVRLLDHSIWEYMTQDTPTGPLPPLTLPSSRCGIASVVGRMTIASSVPPMGSISRRCGFAICGMAAARSVSASMRAARRIPPSRQSSPIWQ